MGESETPKKPGFASHGNGNNHTKHSHQSSATADSEQDGLDQIVSLEVFEETEIEEVISVPHAAKRTGVAEAETLPDVLYRFLQSSQPFARAPQHGRGKCHRPAKT